MRTEISLLLIFTLFFTFSCDRKPSAPENDNPFDSQNQNTGGDPFHLTANLANGGITLTWTIPTVSGLAGFKIYRSETELTGYTLIQSLDRNYTSWVDKNIQNGHSYWYKISALNIQGSETAYTNIIAVNIITDPVVIIQGGENFTSTRSVNLTILANEAAQVMLTDSNDFSGAVWETYSTSKEWILPAGAGEKIVFLKVKYINGNESAVFSDTINPLPINPGLIIAHNAQYTPSRQVLLTLSASGANLQMQIGDDVSFPGIDWRIFSDTLSYQLPAGAGTKRVYARFKNDFEIESDVVYDDISPQPINPSITINNNTAYTTSRDVQITINASGNNMVMKIVEDSVFTGVDWVTYVPALNFQLSNNDGLKKVYTQLINDFEIESAIVSDNIILDSTPPAVSLFVTPDSGITDETLFQFDPTASVDNLTAQQDLQVRFDWQDDGIYDTGWDNLQIVTHVFDDGGGNSNITLELRDAAGWQVDTSIIVFVNSRPQASFTAAMDGDNHSLYHFDASTSSDFEDGTDLLHRWDFSNDGSWDIDFTTNSQADYEYGSDGAYTAVLEVMDHNNTIGRKTLVVHVYPDPLQMVYVAGGTFTMGDTWGDGYGNQKPAHLVTLNSFYMLKYEVTQLLWEQVMDTRPAYYQGDMLPVEQVSWLDAVNFCNKLSVQAGLDECYFINGVNVSCDFYATGYRLPTEAEWEFAARGGMLTEGYRYSGSDSADNVGWNEHNSRYNYDDYHTHEVGTLQPNELGIYDMSGNVREYCWDWYGYYSADAQTNPTGPGSGSIRVTRGGCFIQPAYYLLVIYRFEFDPGTGLNTTGFRIVHR